jgi:hypothetical protein
MVRRPKRRCAYMPGWRLWLLCPPDLLFPTLADAMTWAAYRPVRDYYDGTP